MTTKWRQTFPWVITLLVTAGVVLVSMTYYQMAGSVRPSTVAPLAGLAAAVAIAVMLFQPGRAKRRKAAIGGLCIVFGLVIIAVHQIGIVTLPTAVLVFGALLACIGAVLGVLDYSDVQRGRE